VPDRGSFRNLNLLPIEDKENHHAGASPEFLY
jgi:hypothetical protein